MATRTTKLAGVVIGGRKRASRIANGTRMTPSRCRWLFWMLSFVVGAIVTTPLSIWRNEFVFTWPVALFATFQATVYQVRPRMSQQTNPYAWWHSRMVAVGFVTACCIYFLICRRLSLVTEWAFLTGFWAAAPFSMVCSWLAHRTKPHPVWESVLTATAFSFYYWASVGLIGVKYQIAGF